MHGGSLNVNGNPSWGLSTTWKWKIGADLRAKFSSCSFKGCLLQDAQENIWWMPSAVFLHTAHSERTPFFPLPWSPVQLYPQGEPCHNPSMHSAAHGLALHLSWQFALQPIALGGRKVQVLPWMCITNKRSRIHRGFLKLNQVYTLQRLTVLAVLKCWALARILLPSMSGQWDSLPTSAGH